MSDKSADKMTRLLKLLQDLLANDQKMREQYQIGDKFRFVRDKLTLLVSEVQACVDAKEKKETESVLQVLDDECLVYVYLFNAQGLDISTWVKMVNPSVFYEYSVNRPIYFEKSYVDAYIRSRATPSQHAYLTIIVKRQDLAMKEGNVATSQDAIGQAVIKVREGSLRFEKLISFTHNGVKYKVSPEGKLVVDPGVT